MAGRGPRSFDRSSQPRAGAPITPAGRTIRCARFSIRCRRRCRGTRTHGGRAQPAGVHGRDSGASGTAGNLPARRPHSRARSIPWGKACNEDGTFKSADELKALYGGEGVDGSKPVIAYCRIGERSSHTWFVLKYLLGYDHVTNYDGSWTEWGNLVGAPVERGAAQHAKALKHESRRVRGTQDRNRGLAGESDQLSDRRDVPLPGGQRLARRAPGAHHRSDARGGGGEGDRPSQGIARANAPGTRFETTRGAWF